MVKKILPFLCSLAPFYAFGADSIVLTDGMYSEISTGSGVTVDVFNITGDINVVNAATLTPPAVSHGDLYILNGTDVPFGISSNDGIDVGGVVNIAATRGLMLGGVNTVNINGAVTANGSFAVSNASSLLIGGSVVAADDLSLSANAMTVHDVSVSGDLTLTTTSGGAALNVGTIAASGANSDITSAGAIVSNGTIQNSAGGTMTITSAGAISTTGNLENSGGTATTPTMTVNAGSVGNRQNVTIGGTVKNDNVAGKLNIYANNLYVNGGGAANPSFVNAGLATFNIDGLTSFANGLDLSGMGADSKFVLNTGTLSFGATNNDVANDKSIVNIAVNAGPLNAGAISNGTLNGGTANANANMKLSGVGGVNVSSVYNYGTKIINDGTDNYSLKIVSTALGGSDPAPGNITVSGAVFGAAGTQTVINASDTLSIGSGIADSVSNYGNMNLTGNIVSLYGVSNNGTVNIYGATTTGGAVNIDGSVVNAGNGTMTISATNVTINDAVTNSNGTLNISGGSSTGALAMGSIGVSGGAVNLDSWNGGVAVTGTTDVLGGVLNLGAGVHEFVSGGAISVNRNVYLADVETNGNGDVYLDGTGGVSFKSTSTLTIGGNVIATDNATRVATFDGTVISVNGATGINAQNAGHVIFGTGAASTLDVENDLLATRGGTIEIYSGTATAATLTESQTGGVGGLFKMYGNSFTAETGTIQIADGIVFGNTAVSGMVIDSSVASFALQNNVAGNTSDITVGGGIVVGSAKELTIKTAKDITVSGATTNNGGLIVSAGNGDATFDTVVTNNSGALFGLSAQSVSLNGVNNSGTTVIAAENGTLSSTGNVSTSGSFKADATGNMNFTNVTETGGALIIASSNGDVTTSGAFSVSDGSAFVSGDNVTFNSLSLTGGATAVAASTKLVVTNAANISGNMVQGNSEYTALNTDALSLLAVPTFNAKSLTITNGGFNAKSGSTNYTIANAVNLGTSFNTAGGATANFTSASGSITSAGTFTNSGTSTLTATGNGAAISLGAVTNNSGLTINTNGVLTATSFVNSANANATITSNGMNLTGVSTSGNKAFQVANVLYQNKTGSFTNGVNITNNNYTISASGVRTGGITQYGNSVMRINTSDLVVNGGINATNLTLAAQNGTSGQPIWSNISVDNNVSGGVKIFGLGRMTVGGNYTFDRNSLIHAAALAGENYWADVSLADDNSLGQIVNRNDDPTNALIYVDKQFISNVPSENIGTSLSDDALVAPQIGINLYKVVTPGSAIWFLYADDGLDDLAAKIRNLKVNFCNADGSICFNYFDTFATDADEIMNADNDGTPDGLPIYLSVRDYNRDGVNDSLYIVFDSRFGGPVSVFDVEPIVKRVGDYTDGEAESANGLDNMIAGQLHKKGFSDNSPIETIPIVFDGTNLSELATELYNRMEQYVINYDGTPFVRFARLVQPREIEQVAGSIALNEHTSFRDFEDHVFNEFIWNRNRNLSKVWFDADFGLFRQNISDDKTVSGNRFNITAGYDFQKSNRTILGLMARVSRTSGDGSDKMDLSYRVGETINGRNETHVADTNIGFGGYLMHTLGFKTRVYGNAMLDLHLLNVSREQNYVDDITGLGTSVSLISEWGLVHDWLNQYVVGNLYTRFGYNFGFSLKEKSAGDDYMQLKSDGYFILTPGYSLIAQKRIYTSPWFQVRPYASIGVEYDVLGMPDAMQYKFATSKKYSDYNVDINPLWANIGGGVEMLSATGFQVGLDYRYQYNNDIQIHNLKLSGSLRF